jgi:hypothetical protein
MSDPLAPPSASGGGGANPNLVFVTNLLVAGALGYFLLGQKQKAVAALILFALLLIPPSCGTGSMLLALVAAFDGYQQAQVAASGRSIGQWTFFQSAR